MDDADRYATWDEAPSPTLPLERYASISAELQEKRAPRAEVLRRHDLDEESFTREEWAWLDAMANDAMRGDATVAGRYGELFLAAQDALASPEERAIPIETYAAIRVAMENGEDPARVLALRSMTLPVWMRLDRRMSAAASADPAVRDQIAREVALAEAAYAPLPDEDDALDLDEDDDEDVEEAT